MGLFWGYQRTAHLVLLVSVLVIYLTYWSITYVWLQQWSLPEPYFPALGVLFLLLWFLRGCGTFNCCFPWFHYTTLLIELVVQTLSFGLAVYVLAKDTEPTFTDPGANPRYMYFVYALSAITVLVYFLLAYKLLPVLTTLTCGGQASKEELDKEAKGEKEAEHQPVAP
jgi:hypothetical protein